MGRAGYGGPGVAQRHGLGRFDLLPGRKGLGGRDERGQVVVLNDGQRGGRARFRQGLRDHGEQRLADELHLASANSGSSPAKGLMSFLPGCRRA
jgi:hypothetical protein